MQSQPHLHVINEHNLTELKPWKSAFWGLFQWLSIIVIITVMTHLTLPLYAFIPIYILANFLIAARQHALAILMHEGAHYRLHKNKFWNDVICDVFFTWPLIFLTTRTYRRNHYAHHRHVNTHDDPDWDWAQQYDTSKKTPEWKFPMAKITLMKLFAKDFFGLNSRELLSVASHIAKSKPAKNIAYDSARIFYYVVLVAAITYFQIWTLVILYWMIPMFTGLKVILRIRAIAEHFAIYDKPSELMIRNTYPTTIDRIFIASLNVWYHADHHSYPSVPFYNLPKLHKILLNDAVHKQKMHNTKGYMGVLKECL